MNQPSTEKRYDAFISYSSKDLRFTRRIQRFLESFRFGSLRRRVKVFLDRTDIRGGELQEELREAIAESRILIVCYSPAAAESKWVAQEIKFFRERGDHGDIAVVVLEGKLGEARIAELQDLDCRKHDLRRAWWLNVLRPHARLELLRLLAFITDVELRKLRNWHLRRTLRNMLITLAVVLMPPIAILSYPVDHWTQLVLQRDGQPLHAIAAEVQDERLWLASRYRAPGPQGFRNYIRVIDNAPDQKSSESLNAEFKLSRRLLPYNLVPYAFRERVPSFNFAAKTNRALIGEPCRGEPRPEKFIAVQTLGLTEDELQEATDNAMDFSFPIPKSKGAVVVVWDGDSVYACEVPDLSPQWQERLPSGERTSPSRGLAVAWSNEGEIWLGMAGWDAESSGGLWHSRDSGRSWQRLEGFLSVSSINLAVKDGKTSAIIVAESYFERWRGSFLEPYSSRVVFRRLAEEDWKPAPMPPFGARSEVELCGALNGAEVVRVDTNVFIHQPLPLWRYVFAR